MSSLTKTYLSLLLDTVGKKETLIAELILETMKQSGCFHGNEFEEAKYDEIQEKKSALVREMEALDEGFNTLYERVRDDMKENKYSYETEIKTLQEKIRSITEKGLRLEQLEKDHRARFDSMLACQKKQIKEYKVSKKTAATYYKNMMKQFSNESTSK